MNDLDHLILFLPGPEQVADLFPGPGGLVLDAGTRHAGQGTRNRRAIFSNCFLELVWIDDADDAQRSGLRFEERCGGEGCPFGLVYRGRPPADLCFTEYTVPGGPMLRVLDDPKLPFLAVDVADELTAGRAHRHGRQNADVRLARAVISYPSVPVHLSVPAVSFVAGDPRITLDLIGRAPPLTLQPSAGTKSWEWV